MAIPKVAMSLLVACAMVSCGSNDTSPHLRAPSTSTAVAPTIDQTRVGQPYEIGQRIGLGPNWQLTIERAGWTDRELVAQGSLYNGSSKPLTLPDIAKLISIRDGLFGTDIFASSADIRHATVAPATTQRFTVHFAGLARAKYVFVLNFRGGELGGALSATVWLRTLSPAA